MGRLTRKKNSNPCKYTGVHKCKKTGKFKYIITHKGKIIESEYIYETEKDASCEYQKIKNKIKRMNDKIKNDYYDYDDEVDNNDEVYEDTDVYNCKDDVNDDDDDYQSKKLKKNIDIQIKKKNKYDLIKKNDTPRKSIPQWIRNSIYSRQNNKCNLCKKSLLVDRLCDHILPRYLGGQDNISNYQVLCTECHYWKSYDFDHYLNKLLEKKLSIDNIKNIMFKKYSELMETEESIDSSDSEESEIYSDSEESEIYSEKELDIKTEKSNFNFFLFFCFFVFFVFFFFFVFQF
jgi:hypothetical protein